MTRRFKEHDEVERPDWLGDRWHDSSWHNDAMPHVTLWLTPDEGPDAPCIEFWVNYADPDEREVPPRYEVVFQKTWNLEAHGDETMYMGDDEAAARIWERAARTAKSMIAVILTRPDLMACQTFDQLHDHCDANILGDVEAMTAEGEAYRTPADDPEVGITGWANAVHDGAMAIVNAWLASRGGAQ